jgi:hypothetical protein
MNTQSAEAMKSKIISNSLSKIAHLFGDNLNDFYVVSCYTNKVMLQGWRTDDDDLDKVTKYSDDIWGFEFKEGDIGWVASQEVWGIVIEMTLT